MIDQTTLTQRIDTLGYLWDFLQNLEEEETLEMMDQAYAENPWFTRDNIRLALEGIRDEFLEPGKLNQWIKPYDITVRKPQRVGLILAGNIPAVGFHDLLCCFVSGAVALLKYAEKDKVILPFLLKKMTERYPAIGSHFEVVERLKDMDAVIATGSDNSARYFNAYFGKYPHIIRKNRNGVAILTGEESESDLLALGRDIFSFFGLGCRNVSKIYVPKGYDLTRILEVLHQYNELANHNKYKNNFDYNVALFLINRVPYLNNGCLILLEDERFASRIATLHYGYYQDSQTLQEELTHHRDRIQCLVSLEEVEGFTHFHFGEAQLPSLADYADGIDTMAFLNRK
ncbi:MAG: acyl-CoA reductase [Saprospiraceae bacterium]|nr:acyl-CoA reductase [Saprospiraceae bacterium]